MKPVKLADDGWCFACGRDNPTGLKLTFRTENGKTVAEFNPQKVHQGFQDIVHGGIISTILDEAMVKAVLSRGLEAVTAEVTVRLRSPLYVGDKARIEAEIKKIGKRLIETSARMMKNNSMIIAEARAKLIRNG